MAKENGQTRTGKKELYGVKLPEDFDYEGRVPQLGGTVHAVSDKQAVLFFIRGKRGEANMPLYETFKAHYKGRTGRFAQRVMGEVTVHYAMKYTRDPANRDYAMTVRRILENAGMDPNVIPPFDELCDVMEAHYSIKWPERLPEDKARRNVYQRVKAQQAAMADACHEEALMENARMQLAQLAGECGPVDGMTDGVHAEHA